MSTPVKDSDQLSDSFFETPERQQDIEQGDTSYITDSESEYTESDEESSDNEENVIVGNPISEPKFIVFWSCLVTLFTFCRKCLQSCVVDKVTFKGTLLSIKTTCVNNHEIIWKSQPMLGKAGTGNILLSAAILYSGNTYARISEMFKMINIVHFSSSRFFQVQKRFLFPTLNKIYKDSRKTLHESCISSSINHFSGDGRCDSPGYSAKYGTYSLMNASTNKIVDFQVVHVRTAGNSNLMEKTGLQILLDKFESLKISIASLTTDRHTQIRAMMRDYYPHISHQFDVWHFAKSIKKRSSKLAMKKDKKELNDWIKSIINHF